jgi:hypothetical protein
MKEYGSEPGKITAITFRINIDPSKPPIVIRLPADENKAQDALWLDYVGTDKLTPDGNRLQWNSYKKKTKADFRDQAERTAWKIVQDWVEVQMSMIQTKQAEFLQVFLPYVWDERLRTTFFEQIKKTGYAGLLPEKTS